MMKFGVLLFTVFLGCSGVIAAEGEKLKLQISSVEEIVPLRNKLRDLRKAGGIPAGGVEITLAPGKYIFKDTVQFTNIDSGKNGAPVVWKAQKPGTVSFYGSAALKPSEFTPMKESRHAKRFQKEVKARILEIDVSKYFPQGLKDWSSMELRVPPSPWLYIDGEPANLARWPNLDDDGKGGWTYFTNVVDNGYSKADKHSNATKGNDRHPGAFVYEEERANRWDFSEGVWLYGYWTHDWAESFIKAKGMEISSSNRVLRLAGTHSYGCGKGTWGMKKRRFFVCNLPEELDAPGEWWLDREALKMYVLPVDGWEKKSLELAILEKGFLRLDYVSNMVFENIDFGYSHSVSTAVWGSNLKSVCFINCSFSNLAGYAISLNGSGCAVKNSRFRNLGKGCVSLSGGDRKKLIKAGNIVEGCEMSNFSRFLRTYNPAVSISGCGNIIRNCRIHEGPHMAIGHNGNDHLIEGNEIFNVLLETGDAGAVYTGRNSSWLGTVIKNNYFHDLGRMPESAHFTMAIYFDDCDWGDKVISNRFERLGFAVFIGGGNLFTVEGNKFKDCAVGVHIDSRGYIWQKSRGSFSPGKNGVSWFENNLLPFKPREGVWKKAYPEIGRVLDGQEELPFINTIVDNEFIDCKRPFDFDKYVLGVTNTMTISGNVIKKTDKTK
jgi:hypothetical protein